MKLGRLLTVAGFGLAGALMMTVTAEPAVAQNVQECKCVDRDGQEIERCSCFRTPQAPNVLEQLVFTGSRPRLGISVDADQSARRDAVGALVTDVLDRGPADDAGIRTGDLITTLDGHSLFEPLDGDAEEAFDLDQSIPVQRLLAIARELEPGQEVEVEYVRDDETFTTTIEAEDLSDRSWGRNGFSFSPLQPRAPRAQREQSRIQREQARQQMDQMRLQLRGLQELGSGQWGFTLDDDAFDDVRVFGDTGASGLVVGRLGGARYGLELVELNPALGSYFGTDEGVLVADVDEDSELGLEPGDVVVAVGDRSVVSPSRFLRILGSYAGDEEVTLHIRRDGRDETIVGSTGR